MANTGKTELSWGRWAREGGGDVQVAASIVQAIWFFWCVFFWLWGSHCDTWRRDWLYWGSWFGVDEVQDSPACAGNADTSTLWVLSHKLVSPLPISDYRSDPKSLEKQLSNLLTMLRYKSRNVNQFLANMSQVCKGAMKVSFLPYCPKHNRGT